MPPRSQTIIRAVGTTLTRSDTLTTLDALGNTILALFRAGGTYDLGIDRAWVQWDGTDLDVVLEDDVMSALSADISARNTSIATGLNSLAEITSVTEANIATYEMSTPALSSGAAVAVEYAADAWDEHWEDPTSLPSGWTIYAGGTAPHATASYPEVGTGSAIEIVSTGADDKATIYKVFTPIIGATVWEIRTEIKVTHLGSETVTNVPFTVRDGTRRIVIWWAAASCYQEQSSTGVLMPAGHPFSVGDWVTLTIRRIGTAVYVWAGPQLLAVTAYTVYGADGSLDGEVRLGNTTSAARTATIRRFSIRVGSVNEAPPEYTYRGTVNGR